MTNNKQPISELSDEDLIAEWHHWNDEIKAATGWGAALAAADEFRRACEQQIEKRGLKTPEV